MQNQLTIPFKELLEQQVSLNPLNTYWVKNGLYQDDYDILKKSIPTNRYGDSYHIELLRIVSNMYYEYYNNGNSNTLDFICNNKLIECEYCHGSGVTDFDGDDQNLDTCINCYGSGEIYIDDLDTIELSKEYKYYFDFLLNKFNTIVINYDFIKIVQDIKKFILLHFVNLDSNTFNKYDLKYCSLYEQLINISIELISTTKDKDYDF